MKSKILDYFSRALTIFAIFFPFLFFSKAVFSGSINFWYDSARDLLSAWDNLNKTTLIGPPTGIPGIFYGPYWIWLLSLGLWISKDPRIVTLLVATIPFCLFFLFFLSRFTAIFTRGVVVLIWVLFIYSSGDGYATMLWNPNLTTLLFLILVYLLVSTNFKQKLVVDHVKVITLGIVEGLIVNFHMSLGVGIFFGTLLFFLLRKNFFQTIKSTLLIIFLFLVGMMATFLPFLAFEMRHGFNQLQSMLKALTSYGGVVNVPGLSQREILSIFFGRFGFILKENWFGAYLLEIVGLLYFSFLLWRKKITLQEREKKLGLFLLTVSFAILFIYLTARNPVWEYHFIGTEVIFLLAIGVVISKISFLKKLLFVYAVYLVFTATSTFIKSFKIDPYTSSSLVTKEFIVDTVEKDADGKEYTVFAYSSSIYTYDYSYLFKWRYNKDLPFDPGKIETGSKLVYLIIPKLSKSKKEDFIHYRTPSANYETIKNWLIPDGTEIIKRIKKEEENE